MAGNGLVALRVVFVLDDEDHVETREDGSLEVDILPGGFHIVIAAEDRVSCGEDTGSGVEDGGDAGFGDRDGLLFHCFVDCDTVFVTHLVEFVDTHHAAVCKDHGSAFEVEFAGLRVALDGCCETGRGGAFAGGVDCDWGDFFDKLEKLGFGGTRVTKEEDIDVATELHTIWEDFLGTAKEEEGDSFFDIFVSIDAGADGAGEFLVKVRVTGHFEELLFFGFGELDVAFCRVVVGGLDANKADVGIADGDGGTGTFCAFGLVDAEDAHDRAAGAGDYLVGEVAVGGDEDVTGEFTDGNHIGGFLEFEDLLVDESTFLMHDKVRVHGTAFPFIGRVVGSVTGSGEGDTGKPAEDWDGLCGAAVAAHDIH